MKVFLDANILVSALATRGLCADLMREVLVTHDLILSATLLYELQRVLRHKLDLPQEIISGYIAVLKQDSTLIESAPPLDIVLKDENDLPILASAITGKSEIFVTGDKELQELQTIQSIKIVSPRQFWEILRDPLPE